MNNIITSTKIMTKINMKNMIIKILIIKSKVNILLMKSNTMDKKTKNRKDSQNRMPKHITMNMMMSTGQISKQINIKRNNNIFKI